MHLVCVSDDLVIYTDAWADRIVILEPVFQWLNQASLTLNYAKYEYIKLNIDKAIVTYMGKQVGFGQVHLVKAKVAVMLNYPVPTTWRELKRFLGMTGYNRYFCRSFSVAPLTKLCSPSMPLS